MAPKRRKTQNGEGETSDSPPPAEEETGGETFSPRASNEEETGKEDSSKEIVRAEKSNSATSSEEKVLQVTINPDALKCLICFDPLRPPIRQCQNIHAAHVACLSCWSKLQNKCPTCGEFIGPRIFPFEAVLEAIEISCPNANFGCVEIISYSQIQKHTQQCEFRPSDCAIPECAKMVIPDEQGEETISGEIQREDPPQPSQMERIQEERPKRKRKEKVPYTPSTR